MPKTYAEIEQERCEKIQKDREDEYQVNQDNMIIKRLDRVIELLESIADHTEVL